MKRKLKTIPIHHMAKHHKSFFDKICKKRIRFGDNLGEQIAIIAVSTSVILLLIFGFYTANHPKISKNINATIANVPTNISTNVSEATVFEIAAKEFKYTARKIITFTIYGEARGESLAGKRAVATVIRNRNKTKTDEEYIKVCLNTKQLSCWDENGNYIFEIENDNNFTICWEIAGELVDNRFERDGTWNHFYNPKRTKPDWRKDMTYRTTIGNHIFGYLENYKD